MSNPGIQTVILCGGHGTRMHEHTQTIPKSLVPIGDKPIVWHIMKGYSTHGYNNFILCLGSKGDLIRDYFLNYKEHASDLLVSTSTDMRKNLGEIHEQWSIALADTGEDSLTARRLHLVSKYLSGCNDPYFMLTYGDGVSNVNLRNLTNYHIEKGKLATITVVHPQSSFGFVDITPEGEVERFIEKPRLDKWVNGGFMVLNKEFLNLPLMEENIPLEQVLTQVAKDNQLAAYPHKGCWYCMDTHQDYERLNALWKKGEAQWRTW